MQGSDSFVGSCLKLSSRYLHVTSALDFKNPFRLSK